MEGRVEIGRSFFRPSEIATSVRCADKADRLLGWRARTRSPELVGRFVAAELNDDAG